MSKLDAFTTVMASKVTRVPRSTLNNWQGRGILLASIESGPPPEPRLYSFQDLVAIRVLATLQKAGIDARGLKRVVAYLQTRKGGLSPTEVIASTVLVTDGWDVIEQIDGRISVSALRKPGQAVFMLELGQVVTEIHDKTRAILAATKAA